MDQDRAEAALAKILAKTREVWFESRSERSRRDPRHPGASDKPPERRDNQALQVDQKNARVRG
jgi:hypothetical protein